MVKLYTSISTNDYFLYSGIVAIVIAALLMVASPKIKTLMAGVK
ncbi:hypothetical protein [Mammaliicoccus lentus]|jgi:POT family proton-dependent oligopeptide transporter